MCLFMCENFNRKYTELSGIWWIVRCCCIIILDLTWEWKICACFGCGIGEFDIRNVLELGLSGGFCTLGLDIFCLRGYRMRIGLFALCLKLVVFACRIHTHCPSHRATIIYSIQRDVGGEQISTFLRMTRTLPRCKEYWIWGSIVWVEQSVNMGIESWANRFCKNVKLPVGQQRHCRTEPTTWQS